MPTYKEKWQLEAKKARKAKAQERTEKGIGQPPLADDLSTSFTISSLDKQGLMQAALRQSLTSGSFVNTKFYAFSRRQSTGVVNEPLAIYANSAMLTAGSTYFAGLLDSGFREAEPTSLRRQFPSDKAKSTEEYDYDSDSDLENEASVDGERGPNIAKTEDGVGHSDITLHSTKVCAEESSADLILIGDSEYFGRVVVIPDVAFNTLKALIYYIYTGDVHFRPLRSQLASVVSESSNQTSSTSSAPPCSAKSMYRLAEKYGIDELKEQAKQDILGKLSAANIMTELFSSLTSTYDEIRDMQAEFACQDAQRPRVLAEMPQWIANIASGNSSHTSGTLVAFVAKLSQTIDSNAAMLKRTGCGHCGNAGLRTDEPIFRFCIYCQQCRNPRSDPV
ncbi:hypothetical protein BC835DRAFT_1402058 [Cytidiella melzeri]|nr:hypothetical protein BC835DRAFT_1402058 [Cytidiella melzeri]